MVCIWHIFKFKIIKNIVLSIYSLNKLGHKNTAKRNEALGKYYRTDLFSGDTGGKFLNTTWFRGNQQHRIMIIISK